LHKRVFRAGRLSNNEQINGFSGVMIQYPQSAPLHAQTCLRRSLACSFMDPCYHHSKY